MAFTDYETEQLRKALLKETRHCAVTLGMKKTSVEQLTKAVGIAKGSFYKFYESKEMLFFAVLENVHSDLYGVADGVLRKIHDDKAHEMVLPNERKEQIHRKGHCRYESHRRAESR